MIFDRIENLSNYKFSNEYLNEVISHILGNSLQCKNLNHQIKMNEVKFYTNDITNKRYEMHRNFIDVHIVKEGKEYVECTSSSLVENLTEYDELNDILFGDTKTTEKLSGYLEKGWVLILFPTDAHLVGAHLHSTEEVNKIIYKVPI